MRTSAWFAAVGAAAMAAGTALWLATRPAPALPQVGPVAIAPGALLASRFTDAQGEAQPLGRFQGRWLVLNFWATWCGPCREEMPAFSRLHQRWAARGVQFLGVSEDPPALAQRFGAELRLAYPLWTGGAEVSQLAHRLGNIQGVLPFTVVLDPSGRVAAAKVGAYNEDALESELKRLLASAANSR